MNKTPSQLFRSQTSQNLIQSYSNKQGEDCSKNSQIQTQPKLSIEQLKNNLTNRQTCNASQMGNENQLVYQLFELQQKVRDCEKKFIKKELFLQEQILQAQKNFEKKLNLTKLKYQIQIEDLNSELKMKDEEIYSLNLQIQSSSLNKIGEQIFLSFQKQKSINSEYPYSQNSLKKFQFQMSTKSLNSSRKERVGKHKKELNQFRMQKSEFADKFENEKHKIESDLEILKNKKLILQGQLDYKKIKSQDQQKYKSKTKINKQSSSSSFGEEYLSVK
ncbi:unnamed protein product [Paramecium sonneborni]|uniref:Uncharacterized protein n=1 Tax=Paramecium sonneborni TaxID=65129 RepID=A0A8S1RGA3_9CILI|nr:unnamed protein product [Paramecium sonneborni]